MRVPKARMKIIAARIKSKKELFIAIDSGTTIFSVNDNENLITSGSIKGRYKAKITAPAPYQGEDEFFKS